MNKKEIEIRKVRNAKVILFILVGSLSCTLHAQANFIGTYCIDYDMNDFSVCLTFETDKSFSYEYSGDTGVFEYGQGKYRFVDKHLVLNYNKTAPMQIGHHVSKIWTNNSGMVNVNFAFFDFDGNVIPNVSIIYKDNLSKNGYSMLSADKEGFAKLITNKEDQSLQFTASKIAYNQHKFTIDKNYNYDITVYLQDEEDALPIRNQIDMLFIEKIRPKFFTVKNKNGSVTMWRKIED